MKDREVYLLYDPECPVCDAYCERVEIDEAVGTLKRMDARQSSALMDEVTARGWDIDQGMVLKVDDDLYYGAEAIHRLSLLGSRRGSFNKINHWSFRSEALSRLFYPALRAGRNLLLKILGKTKINNLGRPGNVRF